MKQALRALTRGGPDAVRVEVLAKDLGVTKGGFYWHFDDRQALLTEMLDAWEHRVVDDVIELLESSGDSPRERLRRLFSLAGSGEHKAELSIREWARYDRSVARRLRRVDQRRMDYMRSLFGALHPSAADVEARCLLVMALFIANPLIDVGHGQMSRSDVVTTATEYLLS